MANIQEIDVRIDPDGNVSVEVRGVTGKTCEALTEALEQALGGVVTQRTYKDEYYQAEQETSEEARLSDKT